MMKRVIAFLCVFMYFASPYRLLGHAMPEVLGLIALLLQLTQIQSMKVLKGYGPFMLYMLLVPPIISLLTGLPGDYLTSFVPINLLFYSAVFCILIPNLDMEYVLKYYRLLVYIAIGFFFIQEITYFTIGRRPTLYLPLEMYYEGANAAGFSESRANMDRSSSFFLEPAHFAQYILPYYCLAVSRCLRYRKLSVEFILISFTFLLLQSGSGYIGIVAIFGTVLFMKGFVPLKVKIVIVSSLLLLLGIVTVYFYNNPIVLDILSRIDEITTLEVSAHGAQSGFIRIWRGYYIYNAMAPIYKIFGVGIGSIEYISNLVYIPGVRYEGDYMNGIQTLLVTGGIIGTLLFFRFIYKIARRMPPEGIITIICMISLFFVEHMMLTPKMFLFILVAIAVSNVCSENSLVRNNKYKSISLTVD